MSITIYYSNELIVVAGVVLLIVLLKSIREIIY